MFAARNVSSVVVESYLKSFVWGRITCKKYNLTDCNPVSVYSLYVHRKVPPRLRMFFNNYSVITSVSLISFGAHGLACSLCMVDCENKSL